MFCNYKGEKQGFTQADNVLISAVLFGINLQRNFPSFLVVETLDVHKI